jgi:hypothetical protein
MTPLQERHVPNNSAARQRAEATREKRDLLPKFAQLMSANDKEALLEMAEAWEDRAREAERQEKKEEGKK